MSSISRKYTAAELLTAEFSGTKPLINNLIFERDNILLVGKEKSNKSTLAMQICCHLTTGEPLFGEFDIPVPIDCVYIQAEGKLAGTQSNLRQMTRVIGLDQSRLLFLYYPALPINRPEGIKQINADIDSWKRPKLIVIDPLYQSMAGDLKDQSDSASMTGNLRMLSEYYDCSIFLLHHAHRPRKNKDGSTDDEGDDSVFGSFVWKAFPDTVLLMERVQGNKFYRRLSCTTQRMGNVIEEVELQLIEPSPYYLRMREGQPIDALIEGNLSNEPFTILDMAHRVGRSRRHVSDALYRLLAKGVLRQILSTSADVTHHRMFQKNGVTSG